MGHGRAAPHHAMRARLWFLVVVVVSCAAASPVESPPLHAGWPPELPARSLTESTLPARFEFVSVHASEQACVSECDPTLGMRYPCSEGASRALRIHTVLLVRSATTFAAAGVWVFRNASDISAVAPAAHFGFPQAGIGWDAVARASTVVLQDVDASGNALYSIVLYTGCLTVGDAAAFRRVCSGPSGSGNCSEAVNYNFAVRPWGCDWPGVGVAECRSARVHGNGTGAAVPFDALWTAQLTLEWHADVSTALFVTRAPIAVVPMVHMLPAWVREDAAADLVYAPIRRMPYLDYASAHVRSVFDAWDMTVDEDDHVWMRQVDEAAQSVIALAARQTDVVNSGLQVNIRDAALCIIRGNARVSLATCALGTTGYFAVDCAALITLITESGAYSVNATVAALANLAVLHSGCDTAGWAAWTAAHAAVLAAGWGVAADAIESPVDYMEPLVWYTPGGALRLADRVTYLCRAPLEGPADWVSACTGHGWCEWWPGEFGELGGAWDGFQLHFQGLPPGRLVRLLLAGSIGDCASGVWSANSTMRRTAESSSSSSRIQFTEWLDQVWQMMVVDGSWVTRSGMRSILLPENVLDLDDALGFLDAALPGTVGMTYVVITADAGDTGTAPSPSSSGSDAPVPSDPPPVWVLAGVAVGGAFVVVLVVLLVSWAARPAGA